MQDDEIPHDKESFGQLDSEEIGDIFKYIEENYLDIYCRTWDRPEVEPTEIGSHIAEFLEDLRRHADGVVIPEITPDSRLDFRLYGYYRELVDPVITPWSFNPDEPPDMTEERIQRYKDYISNNVVAVFDAVGDTLDKSPNEGHLANLAGFLLAFDDNDGLEMTENEIFFMFNHYRQVLVRHVFEEKREEQEHTMNERQKEYNTVRNYIIKDIDYTRSMLQSPVVLKNKLITVFKKLEYLTQDDYEKLYDIYVAEWNRKRKQGIIPKTPKAKTGRKPKAKDSTPSSSSRKEIPAHDQSPPQPGSPQPSSPPGSPQPSPQSSTFQRKGSTKVGSPTPKTRRKRKNPYFEILKKVVDFVFLGPELQHADEDEFLNRLMERLPQDISVENAKPLIPQLYDYYRTAYEHRTNPSDQQEEPPEVENEEESSRSPVLPFPFRSSKKRHGFLDENTHFDFNPQKLYFNRIPDRNVKSLKKFMRPNFAPHPYSWEIDYFQYKKDSVTYLFAININSRYVYAIRVNDKTANSSRYAIHNLIDMEFQKRHPVVSIKGDGEKSFERLQEYFPHYVDRLGTQRRREFFFQNSPYTYHNKTIDAVMRTLRDALGPNNNRFWNGEHDEIIQQLVEYYNNTWHRAINMTPTEMHQDVEIEWEYIRHMTEVLNDVKRKQIRAMYMSYKFGQRLMIHLENGKTRNKFKKRRRRFEHVGTFIEYRNGNVVVHVDAPINKNVEVPIFYTKPIGRDPVRERDTFEEFHE